MAGVISIRPTQELEKKIKRLSRFEQADRSTLVRKILYIGAEEELKRLALEMFKEKKVSLGKASEIAGISVREMLELIKEKGISLHVTKEDIKEDFLG